ncbi:MAG: DUF3300 domain-containing protein, partial [Porticoccaceae bacterium]|nr:DUF3300 domain-containing protein [Porticoccaceae bacterium]
YYDTRVVYGHWRWRHYQPVHWTPFHGYAVFPSHRFHWGHGIRIRTNFFFSAFHWTDRRVVVVNHHHTHIYRPRVHITHDHKSRRWHHKPHHRRGVAYRNAKVKKHYRDHKRRRHHQSDLHVSHTEPDLYRRGHNSLKDSKHLLLNKNSAKPRDERIVHQFNHRGEHVPPRGRGENSNKVVRSVKNPNALKPLVGSDLFTIPGNKYVDKNNQISAEPNKRKRLDTPPKRQLKNDLYTVPDNYHTSDKKNQQNLRNTKGSANGISKSPRLVQLSEQDNKPPKPRITAITTNSALIKSRKGSGRQAKDYHRKGSSTSTAISNRDRPKGKKSNSSRSEKR